MVYFSYFHSVIKYGIIFWGNLANISRVFKLQKKVIRIISGVGCRDSCRGLLGNWIFYHCHVNIFSL
jgi:hypothetical protein